MISLSSLNTSVSMRYNYPHFTDEETEAQRISKLPEMTQWTAPSEQTVSVNPNTTSFPVSQCPENLNNWLRNSYTIRVFWKASP